MPPLCRKDEGIPFMGYSLKKFFFPDMRFSYEVIIPSETFGETRSKKQEFSQKHLILPFLSHCGQLYAKNNEQLLDK